MEMFLYVAIIVCFIIAFFVGRKLSSVFINNKKKEYEEIQQKYEKTKEEYNKLNLKKEQLKEQEIKLELRLRDLNSDIK